MPFSLRLFFVLVLGSILLPFGGDSPAATASDLTPFGRQHLIGLDRHYNLSFLWFDRLASGELSFTVDPAFPKQFRAVLEAKTLGVAAWLTGDRVQRYETVLQLTPEGKFQPLHYSALMHKKKGKTLIEQTKLYTFDPEKRTIMMTRKKAGTEGIEQPVKILGHLYPVDFLTAGFNFISGAEGPITAGMTKEIMTFTDEGERKIVIDVLRPEEWPKNSFLKQGSGTLLKITLPPEILDTSGGAVYALLDSSLLPERVIVENVLGMGTVRGELRR